MGDAPDPILAAKRKAKKLDAVLATAAITGCLLLWWLVSATGLINRVLLPAPGEVLSALVQSVRDGTIWINTWASLLRVLEGFLLGACLNSHCSILSECDSTLGYEQVFSSLEYRSDAASAAECAGLCAERPCLAFYR